VALGSNVEQSNPAGVRPLRVRGRWGCEQYEKSSEVEQSDPVDAEAQRSTVAAHLRGIDERVTQAIDMLARLPRFQRKIRAQIGQSASRSHRQHHRRLRICNREQTAASLLSSCELR